VFYFLVQKESTLLWSEFLGVCVCVLSGEQLVMSSVWCVSSLLSFYGSDNPLINTFS